MTQNTAGNNRIILHVHNMAALQLNQLKYISYWSHTREGRLFPKQKKNGQGRLQTPQSLTISVTVVRFWEVK